MYLPTYEYLTYPPFYLVPSRQMELITIRLSGLLELDRYVCTYLPIEVCTIHNFLLHIINDQEKYKNRLQVCTCVSVYDIFLPSCLRQCVSCITTTTVQWPRSALVAMIPYMSDRCQLRCHSRPHITNMSITTYS